MKNDSKIYNYFKHQLSSTNEIIIIVKIVLLPNNFPNQYGII